MALEVKDLSANAGDIRDSVFDPWVRKIPWRRAWYLSPVFFLENTHGHRSLGGYLP